MMYDVILNFFYVIFASIFQDGWGHQWYFETFLRYLGHNDERFNVELSWQKAMFYFYFSGMLF